MLNVLPVRRELIFKISLWQPADGRNRFETRLEYETVRLMAMER